VFIVFQWSISASFCQSAKNGLGYNAPFWRNSEAVAWVGSNVSENEVLYSNMPDAVYFILKRPLRYLPPSKDEQAVGVFFKHLEGEDNPYIICFKENQRVNRLSNSEIEEINRDYNVLVIEADFPEATIWRVK